MQEEFILKREYTSTNKKVGPLDKGWTLNYLSQLYRNQGVIYGDLITDHTVRFEKTEQGNWQSVGGKNSRFTLSRDSLHDQWQIKDCKTHQVYSYNATGLLQTIEDGTTTNQWLYL